MNFWEFQDSAHSFDKRGGPNFAKVHFFYSSVELRKLNLRADGGIVGCAGYP